MPVVASAADLTDDFLSQFQVRRCFYVHLFPRGGDGWGWQESR